MHAFESNQLQWVNDLNDMKLADCVPQHCDMQCCKHCKLSSEKHLSRSGNNRPRKTLYCKDFVRLKEAAGSRICSIFKLISSRNQAQADFTHGHDVTQARGRLHQEFRILWENVIPQHTPGHSLWMALLENCWNAISLCAIT